MLVLPRHKYASDWNAPGQLYGHFVRAHRAPADIAGVGMKALAALELHVEPSQVNYAHGEFSTSSTTPRPVSR